MSNFVIAQEPGKYGGYQSDYANRSEKIINQSVGKIEGIEKKLEDLTKLFFVLLSDFQKERNDIAKDHNTQEWQRFGTRRDTGGKYDFYFTTMDDNYASYNPQAMSLFAKHMKTMGLMNRSQTPKIVELQDEWQGQKTSLKLEILEGDQLLKLKWIQAVSQDELPADFPFDLYEKQNKGPLSAQERQKLRDAMGKIKNLHPELYKRIKMCSMLQQLNKDFPSPKAIPQKGGGNLFEGKEGNLKSFFVLGTARWAVPSKEGDGKSLAYATTTYLTWLYRDTKTDPVDRMQKYSTMKLVHTDNFTIDPLLNEISTIFAKAVLCDPKDAQGVKELKDHNLKFRHLFANVMPTERGSAAISEWFETAIYRFHCFNDFKYANGKSVDLEALTLPLLSEFAAKYDSLVVLGDRKEKQ
jgi:hypothetical protein